jgi:hypothetical protein
MFVNFNDLKPKILYRLSVIYRSPALGETTGVIGARLLKIIANRLLLRGRVLNVRPLSLALCCLLLIGALIACRSHDTEAFYPLRRDAEKSGEFSRGWLPEFLPTSSHAIHVAYDLSPSELWSAFEFEPAEGSKFLSTLKPVDPVAVPITWIPNPHVPWWPKSLEGTLDAQKILNSNLALYSATLPLSQVANERLLFGVDRTKGRAYFYGH